jgi:spermidine/putrescine transport system ATP-binding protein
MAAIVHFQNVTKSYGDLAAVDDLDLTIEAGRFVTLLGPSGCGKSTTLRLLGGFETPEKGRILLSNRDVTHVPPNRRDVNIVFQDYALFPHMSVARNIAFGLELKGLDRAAIHRRVGELLALGQLEAFADRMPAQLSGGQRQRVALMRALAPDPQVLLLDEPLSALDAKLRGQIQIELKSLQERTGKTFLFVTHDQEEALTMSDVIVVMNEGRVEQIGDPATLYHRPRSRFVANFIGETNTLACRLSSAEGRSAVLDWLGAPIRADLGEARRSSGDDVNVVIRPEAIRLTTDRPADGAPLPGRITRRIFKGNHTALSVDLGEGRHLEALADPGRLAGLAGDAVWVGWNDDQAVVIAD